MSTVRVRIGPSDHGRHMSLDEFLDADVERGFRYELGEGVVEVTNIPSDWHAQIVDNLHEAFSRYRSLHPGEIKRILHASEIHYLLPEIDSDRHPDLAIVFEGARWDGFGHRFADLAVEVVSPGSEARRRDYETKREEYWAVGVREYWIVDFELRQVVVLTRLEGPNWSERVFRQNEPIASELLPELDLAVSVLWDQVETGPEDETEAGQG